MLDDAQFIDDTVDAGELGAGHQVSAVYELRLDDGAVPGDVAGTVRAALGRTPRPAPSTSSTATSTCPAPGRPARRSASPPWWPAPPRC